MILPGKDTFKCVNTITYLRPACCSNLSSPGLTAQNGRILLHFSLLDYRPVTRPLCPMEFTRRNGILHLRKHVPRRYTMVEGREQVWMPDAHKPRGRDQALSSGDLG